MTKIIKHKEHLAGVFPVPGDKSISHRSVMLGSISEGITEIEGFLTGEDCLSTIRCFRELGIRIEETSDRVYVYGNGLNGLQKPENVLDVGNSGTTLRLMTGILAGQNFSSIITGDSSIQKRPMDRVILPLRKMGADIKGINSEMLAPIKINGSKSNIGKLTGIEYILPVASAQVKSAILLAGLYAEGETSVIEQSATRDHTEIMLNYLGADIQNKSSKKICRPVKELYGKKISVPGDISSAAFFIVAGLICPGSRMIISNVGVNVTRTGIISALKEMGANINILNHREICGEYVADIEVNYSKLQPTTISGSIIPRMIDEIPVFAVAALFAEGRTVIKDARELKVKESNRIRAMVTELKKMGADVEETDDGMIITGGQPLKAAEIDNYNDHRITMSMAIAGLAAEGETVIHGAECVDISFPGFFDKLEKL